MAAFTRNLRQKHCWELRPTAGWIPSNYETLAFLTHFHYAGRRALEKNEMNKKAVFDMEQIYFGQRIAQLRRERGMTQEAMAQKLGITNQAVSKWESDQCCPDIMQLPALADLLGITLDELFGRPQSAPTELPWPDDNNLRAVCFLGHRLIKHQDIPRGGAERGSVRLDFSGTVDTIQSEFSVQCTNTTVHGSIMAGDGVICGDVGGDVQAGDGVTCSTVRGSVRAGDSITCGDVGGNAQAGDSLRCGNIHGMARAGESIYCTGRE